MYKLKLIINFHCRSHAAHIVSLFFFFVAFFSRNYSFRIETFQQMKVYRHKIIARFGLMHMIGTNLSVWLNVLIQETKHEILTFYDPENRTLRISHRLSMHIIRS